jgi:hypothetical protein
MIMLRPDVSLTVGLAVTGVVYGTYQLVLPRVADVRAAPEGDPHIAKSERAATWTSAVLVSGISLIAKDANIFILGGTATILLAWFYRHGNHTNPTTGVASKSLNAKKVVVAVPDLPATDMVSYGVDSIAAGDYAFG